MRLQFLGGAGTVTGSKYLLRSGEESFLVDCGLFQGLKNLRMRNREPLPIDPWQIDSVMLTHAHIDHSGYLPLLIRNGFDGPVYASQVTCDLCGILLPDSGRLQEEEAELTNRYGYSRHTPALPLYTEEDARRALAFLQPVSYGEEVELGKGMSARFHRAGHILGASMVRVTGPGADVLFSGDLGRPNDPLMLPPDVVHGAEYLVLESTYGDRVHPTGDSVKELADVVNRAVTRRGNVLIPAFAVGRAQTIMWMIHQAQRRRLIPDVPIYLDSPMAVDATEVFRRHSGEHRLSAAECSEVFARVQVVNTPKESLQLSKRRGPAVIISASGMATGGRVLQHLIEMAPDTRNIILMVGYQGAGTRGAALLAGDDRIKIYGQYVPVLAEVASIETISAHADSAEILAWLEGFQRKPVRTFVTHGEPVASDAMRRQIKERLDWDVVVPELGATVLLKPRVEEPIS